MNHIRRERQGRPKVIERRTNRSILLPIFYLMLELIIFALVFSLIYNIVILYFSGIVAFIIMGIFIIGLVYFIKESSIVRFKKAYNRTNMIVQNKRINKLIINFL